MDAEIEIRTRAIGLANLCNAQLLVLHPGNAKPVPARHTAGALACEYATARPNMSAHEVRVATLRTGRSHHSNTNAQIIHL